MRPYFEIDELQDGEFVRLRLTGELDLGSAPALEQRLAQLRAENQAVRLDLSELEFIDSSGIHLLIGAFNDPRDDGWRLEIEPQLSSQVDRVFRLAGLDRVFVDPAMSDH
jgi:anti-sigma B factor antagonist